MIRLANYARFLQDMFLDDLTTEYLKNIRSMEIPLMNAFSHLQEKALFNRSREVLADFLTSLADGTYPEEMKKGLKAWEEDAIPGIKKTDILPVDIIQIYYAQKISMIRFIPRYTDDCVLATGIIEKMEDYYRTAQSMAFKLMFKIKEENDKREIINNELKKLVEERTRNLTESNSELESFTYTVAHDLRAPLRSINGYAQVLKEDYCNKMDQEALNILDIIINSGKKMGMLIDDLLAYTKYGKQKTVYSEVDMNKLVNSILSDLKDSINPAAKVSVQDLPSVKADYRLITQVINNLVGNALKFSSKNENSNIEIGSYIGNPSTVFYVRDNGIGFDMKYYDKLFGVFQRLHKQSEFPGTGVGLAIVKRIMDKHEGKVWAESIPGKETTFYFSLKK